MGFRRAEHAYSHMVPGMGLAGGATVSLPARETG